MFKFLTNRPFWVNLLAAALIAFLVLFLFLKLLGWMTKHGEYLRVPSVVGKKTDEAIKILEKEGFEVQIQDSVFTDTAARGIVLKQLPDPEATVKINRTVFITVNRLVPPMIDMPRLEGLSLNFAIDILERNHLKLGDTTFRPDFRAGSVLEQLYNGGRIAEKTKVQWGSTISLVIGGGLGNQQIMVPDLVGMTYADARATIEGLGLLPGAVIPYGAISDTAMAFVYEQSPPRFDEEKHPIYIQAGQMVDLRIAAVMITPKDSLSTKPKKNTNDND